MEKCHLLALSPLKKASLDPCPSGTLPKASNSFKLLLLRWVSEGSTEHAGSPQVVRVLALHTAPNLSRVQPQSSKPSAMRLTVSNQISRPRCAEFLRVYPLHTPFLSVLFVGCNGGRVWISIN